MSKKRRTRSNQHISIDILIHHGKPCPYCAIPMMVPPRGTPKRNKARSMPTRDHVIPKSIMPGQGVVIACNGCNSDKGGLLLEDWLKALQGAEDARAQVVARFIAQSHRQPHP